MRKSIFVLIAALSAAPMLHAQERSASAPESRSWSLGVGSMVRNSEYAGEGNRTLVFPWVSYEGERFFVRGPMAGIRLLRSDTFEVTGFVAGRGDGFEADDLGAEELLVRGVDRSLLEDRDHSADVGVAAVHRSRAGELQLDLRQDVSDASGGTFATLEYRYPLRFSRVVLTPAVGATHLSEDAADYYYGILDEEVARGVMPYRPGAVTIPYIGVSTLVSLGQAWAVFAQAQHRVLPTEVEDSPLIEDDSGSSSSLVLGVMRRF